MINKLAVVNISSLKQIVVLYNAASKDNAEQVDI